MRAVTLTAVGGPEVLDLRDVLTPEPGSGEVRVRVRAAGVNRADLLQRMGRYPPPPGAPQDILGLEYAGEIDAVGGGVEVWARGDRVMGIVPGGAYAEHVVVPADQLIPIPEGWTFEVAAAVPEAFLTAYDALWHRALLQMDERVLVHAVGSGVGVALLQLAKSWQCEVAGTSRTRAKLDRARALGLDHAVLVEAPFRPSDELRDWANVILDLVGGPYLAGNLDALAPLGRMVVVGLTGGRTAELDMGHLLRKRVTIVGTVLRSRSSDERAELTVAFIKHVLPQLERSEVKPVLDRVFPMEHAAEAHRYIEQNRNFGAVVLAWQ